jgi:streptomycin 6-kinase
MNMFDNYLQRWNLVSDGSPISTLSGHLLPVRRDGELAMLKLATEPEERLGFTLMEWWDGDGAARVLARDGDVLLMERADVTATLAHMARNGRDEEACRILCATARRLHAPRPRPTPELVPLTHWFRELRPAAAAHGGLLLRCAETAEALLVEQREVGVLHGDLHHGNVLDFGVRGWLAIDPKGLLGERGFDFANIFTNPDFADPTRPIATDPGHFVQRLAVVVEAARIERPRLLSWILAWTGLSAAWSINDRASAAIALQVTQLAAAELDR